MELERFQKSCRAAESDLKAAVFLVFGFVLAQLQGFQTCAFTKASPTTKNPRSASLHHFCQCSEHDREQRFDLSLVSLAATRY